MAKKTRIPHKFLPWIDARKQFKLTDSHIQMARELGLSPKRFHKYANRKEEPWKLPLKEFIETLYEKQFDRPCPEKVMTIEEMAAEHVARRAAKKAAKAAELEVTEPVEEEAVEEEVVEEVVTENEATEEDAS